MGGCLGTCFQSSSSANNSRQLFQKALEVDENQDGLIQRQELAKYIAQHERLYLMLSVNLQLSIEKCQDIATTVAYQMCKLGKNQHAHQSNPKSLRDLSQVTKERDPTVQEFHIFLQFLQDPQGQQEFFQRTVFATFDVDGNGYLEEQELDDFLNIFYQEGSIFAGDGRLPTKAKLKTQVMKQLDTNRDGKLEFSELRKLISGGARAGLVFDEDGDDADNNEDNGDNGDNKDDEKDNGDVRKDNENQEAITTNINSMERSLPPLGPERRPTTSAAEPEEPTLPARKGPTISDPPIEQAPTAISVAEEETSNQEKISSRRASKRRSSINSAKPKSTSRSSRSKSPSSRRKGSQSGDRSKSPSVRRTKSSHSRSGTTTTGRSKSPSVRKSSSSSSRPKTSRSKSPSSRKSRSSRGGGVSSSSSHSKPPSSKSTLRSTTTQDEQSTSSSRRSRSKSIKRKTSRRSSSKTTDPEGGSSSRRPPSNPSKTNSVPNPRRKKSSSSSSQHPGKSSSSSHARSRPDDPAIRRTQSPNATAAGPKDPPATASHH